MKVKFACVLAMLSFEVINAQAADIGVSISVGQPGFYGQLNIGDFPRPALINARPIIIESGPGYMEPVYLRVPPGHQKNWSRYCRNYGACGRPVYFVTDRWYNNVYVPAYRERQGYAEPRDRGYDPHPNHDHRDHGWRDDDRRGGGRDDHGGGHGHGHGRGRD